jgi:tetratricopeptide (TPR) repeat protein
MSTELRRQRCEGDTRLAHGDHASAIAHYGAALRLAPADAELLNNRAVARLESGDAAGAVEDFDAALWLNPGYAAALVGRSAARLALGDLAGADADAQAALRLGPTAQAVAGWGAIHHRRKDFAAAAAAYDRAVELDPNLAWVYVLRGQARYHLGDPAGMRADYQRAFELDPRVSAWMILQALTRAARGDAAGELDSCAAHLSRNPGDPFNLARRGLLLVLLGRRAEADRDLEVFRVAEPWAAAHLERLVANAARCSERT